ncbi:MAG TPA: TIGR03619 family F420-dependent LLM class oxidoreductase [Chloroflexota bacterium]|nr:TIGR03619 family F420-dependent LLM class oxidoreductase [Chloroflexota bacterium]
MQTGAVLHQHELGPDVAVLRDYGQTVQDLGYDFIVGADHVVGADPAAYPQMQRVFPIDNFLREPLTVFAFLSAVAPGLGFLTSVIISPQRQTVLLAKQAADIDTLCHGRLRLGVGIGWNPIEYEALGMRFEDRARRFEEQLDVMRQVWTERVVTFEGRFHQLHAAGINPRPIQQPIPIWIGAAAEAAVRRATRIADGFLPLRPLEGGWQATMDKIWGWLDEFGRPRAAFGIEGRLDAGQGTPDEWRKTYEMWRGYGASHLSVSTSGLATPAAHLDRLREVRETLDLGS